jgi:2-succinyl-5-enolpyruvyl-6-hydroxy-3-cyclohexene-1-carboxylate synthase
VGGVHGTGAGPVQLNLAFRDPLSNVLDASVVDALIASAIGPSPSLASTANIETLTLSRGPRTLVIAGDGAGPRAEELAHLGGWPLIAEISSGSRFGRNLVPAYREVLRTAEFVTEVERIVVFGHPTLSREVPALISGAAEGVEVVVVRSAAGEDFNPGRRATVVATDVTVEPGETDMDWLGAWMRAGRTAHNAWLDRYETANPAAQAPNIELSRSSDVNDMRAFASGELAAAKSPVTRELLVDAIWRVTWPHDRVVFGASRLIRVADRTLGGKKVTAFSNRGLAGIDGTISTGVGVALASGSLTRVLLGDLAALHDAGGMLIGTLEARPRIQVVVGNDGGGSLFDSLEVANDTNARLLDRAFFTPHGVDLSALAQAYGWDFVQVSTASELERALTAAPDGPQLVEVVLSR